MSKEFLKRLELFSGMKPDDLDRLYDMTKTVNIPAGEVLIKEGDVGDTL